MFLNLRTLKLFEILSTYTFRRGVEGRTRIPWHLATQPGSRDEHILFCPQRSAKCAINIELAIMMEASFGVDAAPLLAMQNEYDMQMAERNESIA